MRKEKSPAANEASRNLSYNQNSKKARSTQFNYNAINSAALACLPTLLARWLPDGKYCGSEYMARNPIRHDRNLGSFKINLRTGHWSDFATGDAGGDVISLAAYLSGCKQGEAARELARMLGVAHG